MSEEDDISQKTLAVHGGEPRTYPYDALAAPITQTATYSFADTAELIAYFEGHKDREEYGRYGNPSVRLVEEKSPRSSAPKTLPPSRAAWPP